MTDPFNFIEASANGWVAEHRKLYAEDPKTAHLWDSSIFGGPGPLPTLLLTTIGRKSGKISLMPLLYSEFGEGYAIIASKGGDARHPGWYHNLQALEVVKVQIAEEIFQATTRTVVNPERQVIWEQMVTMYPPFADYKASAGNRDIPVIMLKRID
ncbi:MAG TPA: nitroreductase family deazaflavin-dependent oxidoreductase [Pseudomonadales bacterium]|jgi:deazaflavin-dependent oxidoreductase (nitroreductase family)|nr:nitroreductase family deazaflavin-dependent oxidoreductase [Gammaproteobacteria bacterium]HIL82320.1 nitroreductase family deazaflavin-dependent oxidoreductase [Pseudomonadales bacterium]